MKDKKTSTKSLSLNKMKKLYDAALEYQDNEKIIGYIGGVPIIERKDCPPGVLYALNMDNFKLKEES